MIVQYIIPVIQFRQYNNKPGEICIIIIIIITLDVIITNDITVNMKLA